VVGLTGHSLSVGQALRRGLGMLIGGLAGLAGFLWAGFDLRRRAWHDWIAATLVIRLRPPRGAA
jgi:uncharacterized RDD family membrane protein YckC